MNHFAIQAVFNRPRTTSVIEKPAAPKIRRARGPSIAPAKDYMPTQGVISKVTGELT